MFTVPGPVPHAFLGWVEAQWRPAHGRLLSVSTLELSFLSLFVYVLSLAVFAQGTSEFMLSGLVPDIARDMSVSVGPAASLTSAYAIGMVMGAPVMAALSGRLRKSLGG